MQKGDTVYEYRNPDGIIQEVIVTDRPELYIQNCSYTTLNWSTSYNTDTFIQKLRQSKKGNRSYFYMQQ